MKKRHLLPFTLALLLPLNLVGETPSRTAGTVFAVGGGSMSEDLRSQFVRLSPAAAPSVLIIPHAAREGNLERSAASHTEAFRRIGITDITILELNDRDGALEAINQSDLIWMPGGLQRRLMSFIDDAGLADALRARFEAGIPVGGTSAGAAIMSEVMIASGSRDEETGLLKPIFSHGLGFWPEAIVDQHFSERNRISRLLSAIESYPKHIGVGIDESTAALFDGSSIRAIGEGTLTIVRALDSGSPEPTLTRAVLASGTKYNLDAQLEDLAGSYWLTDTVVVQIQQDGDDWKLRIGNGDFQEIEFVAQNLWTVAESGIILSSSGDEDGLHLLLSRYGETVALPRSRDTLAKIHKTDSLPAIVENLTPRLLIASDVPGASIAIIQNGELAWSGQYGIKSHGRTERVNPDTVFEAASMSKPAYAYVVLQLVQEGKMDLDTPLVDYFGRPYIKDEPLHKKITARMVLSHTGGFPNWRPGGRQGGGPVPVLFEPGSEMRYSGEGFFFLQQAIENLTGIPTNELIEERLLNPLGMSKSSYVWQDSYDVLAAAGHTGEGLIPERARSLYRTPNTAFTLYTTPTDYAKILIDLMRQDRSGEDALSSKMVEEMLSIHSDAAGREPVIRRDGTSDGTVHFGLGWRIETIASGNRYCHSGSNRTGFRCYSEFNPATGNGIIIMTNGVGGRDVWEALMSHVGEP